MMKYILAGCSLLVAVTIGSLPIKAQDAKPAPASAEKPAPAQSPASASPAPTPTEPATTPAVSADELKKFASATKQLLSIVNDTETQMVQAVQKQGLTEARFNDIYQSKKNPSAKLTSQVTPKEEESYKQAVTQLIKIQADAQAKMDKVVAAQGLQMERFNQIFAAVQKDPQLRQEVRKMIQN